MPVREVKIAYDEPWHRLHLHSIQTVYGKTSFYDEMEADIQKILSSGHEKLWDLNLQFIQYLISLLPGNWPYTFSQTFVEDLANDVIDLRSGVPAGRSNIPNEAIPPYPQIHRLTKSHLPNLSILDVLCHL